MDYKGVKFIVKSCSQKVNSDGVLEVRAPAPGVKSNNTCDLILEWIPGTEPPEFQVRCENVACPGVCELSQIGLPDGTIVFTCECVGGLSARSTAQGLKGSKKKGTKKKAKKTK